MATIDSLDNRINYIEFYRSRLKNFKDRGSELIADCPFHDDTKQHLYINSKTGVYHCKVCNETGNAQTFLEKMEGLSPEQAYQKLLKIAGIEPKNTQKNPKIDYFSQYAEMKKLPKDFLQALGVKNANIGITIPYLDEAGRVIATKKRRVSESSKGPRFTWNRGAKLIPYGLWRLKEIREAGYCILVEGESDSQTLWLHNFQCLGIPGAGAFKSEWVDYVREVPKIYIHQEPGEGGETFLRQICGKLLEEGYRGKAYVIHTPGHKDPSDLHVANPDGFKEVWRQVLDTAQELDLADFEPKPDEIIPNAPVRLRTPNGWLVNEKGVHQETKDGLVTVCATPLLISRFFEHVNNKNLDQRIEICFYQNNQWHSIRTQKSIAYQSRTIVQLADRGLLVTSENAKKVVKYIGDLVAENLKNIPTVKFTDQMGWISSDKFFPGIEGDVVLDVDEGSAYMAAAYDTQGEYEKWKQIAQKARGMSPVARFVLAASFAAPLLSILNHRIFIIHCWGPSRGGKTALLKLALSVWGNPDILITNFNTTKVGLERMAAFFNDLPLGIDEKQVVGDKQGFIEGLVYLLGLGKGKARGTKGGGLQQFKTWRTIALTTGEEPISTTSSNTGIISRTLEIWDKPIPDENFAQELHDLTIENFGWAGRDFIQQVIKLNKEKPNEIKDMYGKFVNYFKAVCPGSLGSHYTAVAVVATADYLINKWIFNQDNAADTKEMGQAILEKLESASMADYAEREKEWLDSWIAQHIQNFNDDAKERYGWIMNDGYAILPSILEPELRKAGFSPARMYADFKEKGWIMTDADGKHVKPRITIEGKRIRVIYYYKNIDIEDDTVQEDIF